MVAFTCPPHPSIAPAPEAVAESVVYSPFELYAYTVVLFFILETALPPDVLYVLPLYLSLLEQYVLTYLNIHIQYNLHVCMVM